MTVNNVAKKIELDVPNQVGLHDLLSVTELVPSKKPKRSKNKARTDLEAEESAEVMEPVVDPRNSMNDLTGKEWLPETKSFFYQKGLGAKHTHAQIERLHPAPYSFQDIARLVLFLQKKAKLC